MCFGMQERIAGFRRSALSDQSAADIAQPRGIHAPGFREVQRGPRTRLQIYRAEIGQQPRRVKHTGLDVTRAGARLVSYGWVGDAARSRRKRPEGTEGACEE